MQTLSYLSDYLERNAIQAPNKPAVIADEQILTWGELDQKVEKAASAVRTRLPQDTQQVVVLLFPNSWQFFVAYLGIVKAGHIAMPLDTTFRPPDLQAIISQVPSALVITDQAGQEKLPADLNSLVLFEELLATTRDVLKPLRLPPDQQIASMLFTSGTTGKPKAAPYTHANHLWNISASSKVYKWVPEDTILLSLPLSHWHGMVMGISGALYHSNTIYLQERLEPEATLTMLASGKISLFMHVSLAYSKLVQYAPEKKYDLRSVRLCISASSALSPVIWQEFKDRFGIEVLERYGSSEAGQIASNSLTERIPGSPGKALPGGALKISPEGEVMVKSPGIFPGYYHNEEATQQNLTKDGWWLTGDIGELDEKGHVYLKGRKQERIKKQGYSVYPRDVEWALQRNIPAIQEVYVMGVSEPDTSNDQLVYFVVGPVTEAEILISCKQQMQSAWRPDRVVIVDTIPRTRSGKPILAELRKLLA